MTTQAGGKSSAACTPPSTASMIAAIAAKSAWKLVLSQSTAGASQAPGEN